MNDSTIKIELSKKGKNKGKYVAIVDSVDADLADLNWCAMPYSDNLIYAMRTDCTGEKRKTVRLHREIMERMLDGRELAKDEFIDHKDGNPLNNRRGNLRIATKAENMRNSRKQHNNTSGYKGVSWNKSANKWRAEIRVNYKGVYLGLFDTPELAYAAYCEAAKEYFGEFANFGE